MTLAGRIVGAVGLSIGLGLVLAGIVTPVLYFGSVVFVGLGNGLTLPAANSGVMSVRPRLAGSAGGLSGALTVAGGAVLTSLTGTLLTAENGAVVLMLLMLGTVAVSLVAALYVRWVDLRDPLPT